MDCRQGQEECGFSSFDGSELIRLDGRRPRDITWEISFCNKNSKASISSCLLLTCTECKVNVVGFWIGFIGRKMGQILDAMCCHYHYHYHNQEQQSKGKLLYEFAISGDVEAIKALCRSRTEGCAAALEWTDGEGKTPLIAACTSPQGFEVAKALIKLGANVNAYCPGPQGGTPLHYAAREGLGETVELLFSHGATASVRNHDGQTPLDVAHTNTVVHMIESIEDVELATALSSSIESAKANNSIQNSFPATQPETVAQDVELAMALSASFENDIGNKVTQNSVQAIATEDVELGMALSSSIESAEDAELRKALNASIKSALEAGRNRWSVPNTEKFGSSAPRLNTHDDFSNLVWPRNRVVATPSAPPIPDENPNHHPSSGWCSCIICYEAPIEGVCSPCGHMAACMSCLNKIEAEKSECPVCRAQIDKVIKVFGVG